MEYRLFPGPRVCYRTIGLLLGAGLVLSACQKESPPQTIEDSDLEETSPTLPSVYVYEADDTPEPELSLTTLGIEIPNAVLTALTLDPQPFYDHYVALEATADPSGCPFVYVEDDGTSALDYWFGECTAESGSVFSGYGYLLLYNDLPDDTGGLTNGYGLFLSGRISATDGAMVQGAGTLYDLDYAGEGYNYDVRYLDGTFSLEGPDLETGWLDGSMLPSLSAASFYIPAYEGNLVALEGGLSGLEGAVNTVSMSGVGIYDAVLGSTCPREPSGTISVRDAEGEWYDVAYDGPTEEDPDVPAALCDGCGSAWYRGQYIGEACSDFSALLDWKDKPW